MNRDYGILRELGKKLAEIANNPIQNENKRLWMLSNDLKQERPMVCIDQLPWHELNFDNELSLLTDDQFCKALEEYIRKQLFKWKYFKADMVIENYIPIPKIINGLNLGLSVDEDIVVTDINNSVVGHRYYDQLQSEEDLEKIKMPVVSNDVETDRKRLDMARDIFRDIIEIKSTGVGLCYNFWDRIVGWRGAENAIIDLLDRPDYVHKILKKISACMLSMTDQLESKGLLEGEQSLIHATYAYTNELPKPGYDQNKPRTNDVWTFGMAQIFSTVSPAMHEEFEINYVKDIFKRYGLVYYGCCEPLHEKIDIIRKLPNVRKISVTPWANPYICGEKINRDFVFSAKPSPAYLAVGNLDIDAVKKDIIELINISKKNNCNLELILKDISTVGYDMKKLIDWEQTVMALVKN